MLAPRILPESYAAWNHQWHAPHGPDGRTYLPMAISLKPRRERALGPFVRQPNSSTRSFEYPWAYDQAAPGPGRRVLEIGGGLSGLQFVLAMSGAEVVNVDPLLDYGLEGYGTKEGYGQEVAAFHARLNRLWRTSVSLLTTTVDSAGLGDGSFDVVICISTIEHLSAQAIEIVLREAARVLRPGGHLLLTVDLFLNLAPFTTRQHNEWGTNVSVEWLVRRSGLELLSGAREELLGYPEFDPVRILANLERYAVSTGYPQLAQAVALAKPGGGAEETAPAGSERTVGRNRQ